MIVMRQTAEGKLIVRNAEEGDVMRVDAAGILTCIEFEEVDDSTVSMTASGKIICNELVEEDLDG